MLRTGDRGRHGFAPTVLLSASLLALLLSSTLTASAAEASRVAEVKGLELEVTAGIGGKYQPSAPVPVTVTITAERLTHGRLVATTRVTGRAVTPGSEEIDVEVPGASAKTYRLFPNGPVGVRGSRVDVRFVASDGSSTEQRAEIAYDRETEFVGLFPGVATKDQVPEPIAVPMMGDDHRAAFAVVGGSRWPQPVLGPFTTIVATADDLDGLDAAWRRALVGWVWDGGRLAIDSRPDVAAADLPAAWFDGAAEVAWGMGHVSFTDGAAARAEWANVVRPNGAPAPDDQTAFTGMLNGVNGSVRLVDQVGRLAGFRTIGLGVLIGVAIAYIVVVGPLTFLALSGGRRSVAIWAVVPLLAVIATGGVFAARAEFRAEPRAGHLSIVRLGGGDVAQVTTILGVASDWPTGRTARFPAGWSGTPAYGTQEITDAPEPVVPVTVSRRSDATLVRAGVSDGDFGTMAATGPVGRAGRVEIAVDDVDFRTVSGTVTNRSGFDLDHVVALMGNYALALPDLHDGASAPFRFSPELNNGKQDEDGNWVMPDQALADWDPTMFGANMMGGRGMVNNFVVVNGQMIQQAQPTPPRSGSRLTPVALLDLDRAQHLRANSRTAIVVAGWTGGYTPPVSIGGTSVGAGRSLIIDQTDDLGGRVGSKLIRGTGGLNQFNGRPAPANEIPPGAVAVFDVGDTAGAPVVLETVGAVSNPPKVWTGSTWIDLTMHEDATKPVEGVEMGLDPNGKPFPVPTEPRLVATVPPEAVVGGRVSIRIDFFGPAIEDLRVRRPT